MKAVRYYGPGDVRVEQIDEPVPQKGQVKIKIAWNGICGSDLHAYIGPEIKFATSVPDPLSGECVPITLGHEFSGTIVSLGPEVDETQWKCGQNVVVEPLVSCLKCHVCESGSRNLCHIMNTIGIGGWGGGLAEYVTVDVKHVHILPAGVPLEVGACIEPLAVAWHAVKRSGFVQGQSALILGAGPIGIFLLKVLRSFDSSTTIVISEPAVLRRDQANKHGATHIFNPLEVDIPEAVLGATQGLGVDIAFDAAGVQASIDAALQCVRPRGVIVNVAVWKQSPTIDMNLMVLKEVVLTASIAYDRVHAELLKAIGDGKISGIEDLITSKIAIDDVIEKGFLALLNDKDAQMKILVHP